MNTPFTLIRKIILVFWLAFVTLALQANAQTISNTAQASWMQGRDIVTRASNTVAFDVVPIPPTKLTTFVASPAQGVQAPIYAPRCGAGNSVAGAVSSGSPLQVPLKPSNKLRSGETLYYSIDFTSANLDPGKIESIITTVRAPNGDVEQVEIFETGPNTGRFAGFIGTQSTRSAVISGDCALSVATGDVIEIAVMAPGGTVQVATAEVDVLADPFGLVFDSEDGEPVAGVTVKLVDANGAPARVFGEDGKTSWPSEVMTGSVVTDGNGRRYQLAPGEYWFPLVNFGQYRLIVVPPAPYTAFSRVAPAQLAGLTRPDGGPLQIMQGSYGEAFAVPDPTPVRVDVPVDRPPVLVQITKSVSRGVAQPGDAVIYRIVARNGDTLKSKREVVIRDYPSSALRLDPASIRVDGVPAPDAVTTASDGNGFVVRLGTLVPGAERVVTYVMTVRNDTSAGQVENRATATDSRGGTTTASATLKIEDSVIAQRMTMIGRVTDNGCNVAGRNGIPGVRVIMEDGSFAITDQDGRYHFEGVVPGSHVVQVMPETLPEGGKFINCGRSTRQAGSAISRFVSGQGGSLAVADFYATLPEGSKTVPVQSAAPKPAEDREAAGGTIDWETVGDGADGFLFPEAGHNPRAPAVRVAVRHRTGQKVELSVNGVKVDPVSYEGEKGPGGAPWAVSLWRSVPLPTETNRLHARVLNADGSLVKEYDREVAFVGTPAKVELLADKSRLIADGRTRPVVALRFLDRQGRPLRSGMTGSLSLNAPYEMAQAVDAMQNRALSGLGRQAPQWMISGDEGIAYVELAPTMVSGALKLDFTFIDRDQRRSQSLEGWIVPGDTKWTLVGLAEGAVGARSVADAMERTGRFDTDLGKHARVAFYAKGRILGKFLLTAAYDSAKQRDAQTLHSVIDPRAYYTVFADGSDRRFDAASREKLYVRIEAKGFYALYGDFDTALTQTQLGRYQRSATGVKAALATGGIKVEAYAAKIASGHRREEFQGAGISGPYTLATRAILPGSEQVTIEVRDRFRSEIIVNRKTLARFVDYTIDVLSGTITFREPILSRDVDLNPQFIVVEYEADLTRASGGEWNAGGRASWTSSNDKVRVGATFVSDKGENARTDLIAADVRVRPTDTTEIRGEFATSHKHGKAGTPKAWLVEAEHRSGKLDILAYARSADKDFGVGQTSGAELGRRKLGMDARVRLNEALSVSTSVWHDVSLTDKSTRTAAQVKGEYRSQNTDIRLGVARVSDRLSDGRQVGSTVLEGGVSQRFMGNRLQLDASTSIALNRTESIDLPTRHTIGLRYALTQNLKLVGTYEIADGAVVDARMARVGFEFQPWNGTRLLASLGQQNITEYGKRSFANFGLSQSFNVSKELTIDATLDANRVLSGGLDASRIINPAQPVTSGGFVGTAGQVSENFTAVTLGATWRRDLWSVTLRGERRNGADATRTGLTVGAIRQLGDGQMIGAGATWTRATTPAGGMSQIIDASIAAAIRPADSAFAMLGKLEYRSDEVRGATAGLVGTNAAAGRTALTVTGDARSRRMIASVSTNWSPLGDAGFPGEFVQRTEIATFAAVRHTFDRYEGYNLGRTNVLGGIDAHIGIGESVHIGGTATVRADISSGTIKYAFGPLIGFVPAKDVMFTVGYNFTGFHDPDFVDARNTRQGVFATVRMKFDASSFEFLGLGG